MDRPTFFILGATKSGTTTLYRQLGQHPDILMSHTKEPGFFAVWYEEGLDAYWRAQFSHWVGQRVVGEASTLYLRLPYVARRIHRDVPGAKLIACLRHPVDRAYAEWWMNRVESHDRRPFEVAILDELVALGAGVDATAPHLERLVQATMLVRHVCREPGLTGYLSGGHYRIQLQTYLDLFPHAHVKIVLFDTLLSDPGGLLHDLYVFLGVDPTGGLTKVTPQNAARGSGRAVLSRVPGVRRFAHMVPPWVRTPLRRLLDRMTPRPPMNPATRRLLLDHYRDHNRALETLLEKDLSHWNQ